MATGRNGSLRVCVASAAIGGIVAFGPVSSARAQWLPPWGGASPVEIERSLEAQGFGLIAPLVRRPGVYLADVTAGPAGYQRLVVDARSGQILERFGAPGRRWGPTLAARNDEFGEPQPGSVGPPFAPGFSRPPAEAAPLANLHVPAAVAPYGHEEATPGAKGRAKPSSIERKAKLAANPPLPPPAPREAARPNGSGLSASEPANAPQSNPPKIDPRPTEVENAPAAAPAAPATQGSSGEGSDKSKVSIVPSGAFE